MVIPYKQKQQFFPIYVMTKVHFEMIARGRMIEDTQCSGGSFSGLDRSLSLFVASASPTPPCQQLHMPYQLMREGHAAEPPKP